MRRHYGETKAQKQARWNADFADALTALDARYAGRIAWSEVAHFWYTGVAPADAARRYAGSHPIEAQA